MRPQVFDPTLTGTDSEVPRGILQIVVVGNGSLRTFAMPEGCELKVGRTEEAVISLPDARVSRCHAVLSLAKGSGKNGLTVEDLDSRNGTFVGQKRLAARTPTALAVGDHVRIGSYLLLIQADSEGGTAGVHDRAARFEDKPSDGAGVSRVVRAPRMQEIYQLAERVAAADVSVLILGETGVGKDVLAQFIHDSSRRSKKPFVRLNCSAFAESLLESELFGHERGAFTGAFRAKQGLLESAEGGTVFLDELGEMPLTVQAKLLQVLETREVSRVGSLRPRAIDVRFVAATNRDVEADTYLGRFRSDLYFRLNGFSFTLPPLRDRPEEILPLAELFLEQAQRVLPVQAPLRFSDEAVSAIMAYAWPGNIRELRNTMQRMPLVCARGIIGPEHLPFISSKLATVSVAGMEQGPPSDTVALDEVERQHILQVLEGCRGNQTQAAKALGISRGTLLAKLDSYAVPRPRKLRFTRT